MKNTQQLSAIVLVLIIKKKDASFHMQIGFEHLHACIKQTIKSNDLHKIIEPSMIYKYNEHTKVASCQHDQDYIRNPFHNKVTACRENSNS